MSTADPSTSEETNREFVTTRVIDAPRELVFRAFTEPEHLALWWGPKDFRNTFQEFDLRPGGHWRFVMHGPDGQDYKNHTVFQEVVKPERIVFEHASGPHYHMIQTYEDLGDQTRLTWRMRFATAGGYDMVKGFVPRCNEENFDRLEAELTKMKQSSHL